MKELKTILRIIRKYKKQLHENFGVKNIYVFGSYAREEQTSASDLDLLVDLEAPLGLTFIRLVRHLKSLCGVPVDVATVKAAKQSPRWTYIKKDLVSV